MLKPIFSTYFLSTCGQVSHQDNNFVEKTKATKRKTAAAESPRNNKNWPTGQKNAQNIETGRARNSRNGADEQARRSKPKAQKAPRKTKQTHKHPTRQTERKETTKMHKTCELGVASGSAKILVLHDISSNPYMCNLLSTVSLKCCFILSHHPRL